MTEKKSGTKLGRNPFATARTGSPAAKLKTAQKKKMPPSTSESKPDPLAAAAGARTTGHTTRAPHPTQAHASSGRRFRIERLSLFRFENLSDAQPTLSFFSAAVRLPSWTRTKNHYEFRLLRRPFSISLVSLRIQHQ
jgi:hypothetical protein